MASFKDKKNGSWYVQFRYTDWRGERQQKLKRGFATKKEAQAWEREFLMQKQADVNMSFESFVALYEKDVKPKLKLNTWLSKEHIIRTKILPYFKKRKLSEITARDVIDWQNEIRQHTKSSGESYSPDYLKNVHRQQEQQAAALGRQIEKIQNQQVNVAAIEKIEAKSVPFSNKVSVEREDFERLSTLAKKYITAEKKESKLQKALDAANRLIARLKAEIAGLKQELSEYKSVRGKLRTSDLERENAELRGKVQRYEDVIQRNNLWHFFRPRREKAAMRDDAR